MSARKGKDLGKGLFRMRYKEAIEKNESLEYARDNALTDCAIHPDTHDLQIDGSCKRAVWNSYFKKKKE